jgi:DNA excision repair protein ERCC-2
MMTAFKSDQTSVLLAIQGGRFSEGEDFPGETMDVSIVVGLSLPPPSPTLFADYQQMENDRFDKQEAYMVLSLLPALRKAIQSAGRHVRNPGKVGMVFFLDHRFGDQKVLDLMPSWLRADLVKGEFEPERLGEMTREFLPAALTEP